jgi:hypothetical protein
MSNCGRELPLYRCHKEVWALKIREVIPVVIPRFEKPVCRGSAALGSACGHCERCQWLRENGDADLVLVPEDGRYVRFCVSQQYANKHKPHAGGYYVVYKDGYQSFSPAEAFEEGYTLRQ